MTKTRALLVSLCFLLVPELAAAGSMTFGARTVTANVGTTSPVLWYGAAETPSTTTRFLDDLTPDSSGMSQYSAPVDIPANSIWMVFNIATGAVQVDSPTAGLPAKLQKPVPAIFPRDEQGKFSRVSFQSSDTIDLIWIRPGVGAWYLPFSQRQPDLDGIADNFYVASASSFRASRSTPSAAPAEFRAGDVVAGAAAFSLRFFVGAPPVQPTGIGTISALYTGNNTDGLSEAANLNGLVSRSGGIDAATFTYSGIGIIPGTIKFDAGVVNKYLPIDFLDDDVWSGWTHSVTLQFRGPDGSASGPPFSWMVSDNDLIPLISIEPLAIKEGDTRGQRVDVTLVLTGKTTVPASITFSSGGFFTPVSTAPVVFAPGETRKTVAFTFNGDSYVQGDRQIALKIGSFTDCTTAQDLMVKVIDDDVVPTLTIEDVVVNEASASARFTARLTGGLTDTLIQIDTASGSAIEGTDFAGYHQTWGLVTQLIMFEVPLIHDSIREPAETFKVNLTVLRGATPAQVSATATIIDTPLVSIADVRVLEGDSGVREAKVRVSLSAVSPEPVTVKLTSSDGTATEGTDYVARRSSITIPAGASSITEGFLILGDEAPEPDETFNVSLSSATGAVIDRGIGVITIINDDSETQPLISIDDAIMAETDSGTTVAVFRLHLDRASSDPISVAWATSDGTASSPSDYSAAAGVVTFAPGVTEATITVVVNGDTSVEADEDFQIVLSDPVSARLLNDTARGVIANDDGLPPVNRKRVAGRQ